MPPEAAKPRAEAHACWDSLLAKYSWPQYEAFDVLYCESKGNPWAHNPSGAEGLFQDMDGPQSPAANVAVAYDKWQSGGDSFWDAWKSSYSCWG